jgi:ATP-dependent Clp protease ATP-binding subunit ClpC
VAAVEGANLKATAIDPIHLLLGLCKVVDLDLDRVVSQDRLDRDEWLAECQREVGRLRAVFKSVGFDPMTFRRRLRSTSPIPRFSFEAQKQLRRSPAAKKVFSEAERCAELGSGLVYPIHLLYAVLLSEDAISEQAFDAANVGKKSLLAATKREALIAQIGSDSQQARTRWN